MTTGGTERSGGAVRNERYEKQEMIQEEKRGETGVQGKAETNMEETERRWAKR